MNLTPDLLEILACPNCHAPLRPDVDDPADLAAATELRCTSSACGLRYPIREGIPVLLIDEATRPEPPPATG